MPTAQPSSTGGYPPSAFHFRVVFAASLGKGDTSFQEVSGIGSELQTEDVEEGGENRFVYQLPTKVTHPKLVLKRGIAPKESPLVGWCQAVLEGDFIKPIVPVSLEVFLLNEQHTPLRAWSFVNAYPVNWDVESFLSTKNEVAIEKIELCYHYSNRIL